MKFHLPRQRFHLLGLASIAALWVAAAAAPLQAQTWSSSGSNSWNLSGNWTPGTIPNATTDTAVFGSSSVTNVVLNAAVSVDGIQFGAAAPSYTLGTNGNNLSLFGAGLSNSSGTSQTLFNTGQVNFYNSSSADNAAILNNASVSFQDTSSAAGASINNGGLLSFGTSATAANAGITNSGTIIFDGGSTAGGASITNSGNLDFKTNSDAGNSNITNNSNFSVINNASLNAATITNNSTLTLTDSSTAANAQVTNNDTMTFALSSTAGAAAITTTNGAKLFFNDDSLGGTSSLVVNGGGQIDMGAHNGALTVGSLAGAGSFYIGPNALAVGANDLSATFAGAIDDGAFSSSFTKVGAGTMTLSGANTYDGGTTIAGGTVKVDTGGQLGTGGVFNNANLYYINSSSAGNLAIRNDGTMKFLDNSTSGNASITVGGYLSYDNNAGAGSASINNTNSGNLVFLGSASAETSTITNDGSFSFFANSTAGSATITNNSVIGFAGDSKAGSSVITNNATILFDDNSSMEDATVTNNGAIYLDNNSAVSVATAGNSNITNNNNSNLFFKNDSTAGSASITMNSGSVAHFDDDSTGGDAQFVFQNGLGVEGVVDITGHNSGSVTVGSIEGDGTVELGNNNFATGANNLSTTFTGVINNQSPNVGSFTKVGTGTLVLTGTNTYDGGTTIAGGILKMSGVNSQLGTGAVQNNANLSFVNGASAQSLDITNGPGGGTLYFYNDSNAGTALVVNNAGSTVGFYDSSLGGHSVIVNAGNLEYHDGATADSGTVTNTGSLSFWNNSSAGAATIVSNNGGEVDFLNTSDGGSGRFILNTGSALDISSHVGAVTVGSVEGDGAVHLGGNNLATGTNDEDKIITGTFDGTGSLTKMGIGTLTLFGASTYSGGTLLNSGVLAVVSEANLGDSAGALTFNGGTLKTLAGITSTRSIILNTDGTWNSNGVNSSSAGVISGNGGLVKIGTGTLTLSGANSYAGGTDIEGGVLAVDTGGSLGTGNVTNNASLHYVNSASAGGVTVTTNNGANVGFYGSAEGGTARFILNGTAFMDISNVQVGNSVTVGSLEGAGSVSLGGNNLAIGSNDLNTTYSGVFLDGGSGGGSGGSLTKVGAGQLTLASANGYTGGTTLSSGSLNLQNNNALGTGNLTFGDGATLKAGVNNLAVTNLVTLNGTDNVDTNGNNSTLSGVISGSGALTKLGLGTLTLSGTNSYGGGTDVEGGILAVSSDSNLGDASGSLTFNGTGFKTLGAVTSNRDVVINSGGGLVFDTNGFDSTFNGVVSGTGQFTKVGAGALTLTGANNFSNSMVINGGTLVAGNSNALGTGTVNLNIGTLASNGTTLTLNVGGDYVQGSAATLKEGIGGAAAGLSDSVSVVQTADLNGTLSVFYYGSYLPQMGDAVTLLTADNGVNGRFSQLISPTGSRWFPIYQPFDVYLLALQPSFAAVGLTPNQVAVGTMLDVEFLNPKYGTLILAAGMTSSADLPAVYDEIAPEDLTALFQIGYATARNHQALVESRLSEIREAAAQPSAQLAAWDSDGPMLAADLPAGDLRSLSDSAPTEDKWGVFVTGSKNIGTVSSDANAAGYQMTVNGMSGGADYRIGKDFEAGLLLSFDQTSTTSANGAKMDVSGGQAGIYGGWHPGGFFAEALAEGGLNSYKTSRQGYGAEVKGENQGQQFSGWLGGGYDWKMGAVKLSPYLAGQATVVQLNAYSETGSMAPLDIPAQSQSALSAQMGTKIDWNWKSGAMNFRPKIGIAWEHQFQGYQDSLSSGLSGGGQPFTVQGPALGQDAAVVGAELNVQFARGLSAAILYQGKFGQANYDSQSFTGGMSVGF